MFKFQNGINQKLNWKWHSNQLDLIYSSASSLGFKGLVNYTLNLYCSYLRLHILSIMLWDPIILQDPWWNPCQISTTTPENSEPSVFPKWLSQILIKWITFFFLFETLCDDSCRMVKETIWEITLYNFKL